MVCCTCVEWAVELWEVCQDSSIEALVIGMGLVVVKSAHRGFNSQAILARALGTSWDRGVRRISLVRLRLGPPAVGFA